jgi:hypothetical protein
MMAVIGVYDAAGQRDRDARAEGRFQRVVSDFPSFPLPVTTLLVDGPYHCFCCAIRLF